MKVKKIMTAKVKTCLPNASLIAAAELMRENNCGILPVMNKESKVVGVITDRDICLALGGGKQPASQTKVGCENDSYKIRHSCRLSV
jgi:CBS domain-containing protein